MNSSNSNLVIKVALPVRLDSLFDYLCPADGSSPVIGARVIVPFRNKKLIGIALGISQTSEVPIYKLRNILRIIDNESVFDKEIMDLLIWVSNYYHYPIGEVMHLALPRRLRESKSIEPRHITSWRISDSGVKTLENMPHHHRCRRKVLSALVDAEAEGLSSKTIVKLSKNSFNILDWLRQKNLIEEVEQTAILKEIKVAYELNNDQKIALRKIISALEYFSVFLLEGVTGSGKTEVYLQCASKVVEQGKQVLILVPEIALTPQLIDRFSSRFGSNIAVIHSGLTDVCRHNEWWRSRMGNAKIILGTRSAIFVSLKNPGLIIVDEEHDISYKQQDGFRYNARDISVKRAQINQIPVILGSATPSLETVLNAKQKRYQKIRLASRVAAAKMPIIRILDLNHLAVNDGLTAPVIAAIESRLKRGEQILVFVNRRGFAPIVSCSNCRWQAKCNRCDSRLTLHKRSGLMICHHCSYRKNFQNICPSCGKPSLVPLGEGTQRVESSLKKIFPDANVSRIDSDAASDKDYLGATLKAVQSGEVDILVGTQMLSKGHDFPNITLVCVLGADQGLFSVDFRGSERLFQLLMQVSGRAGRGRTQGEVLIQTSYPDSHIFNQLLSNDFKGFSTKILEERESIGYPPYRRFILLRAESVNKELPLEFLDSAVKVAKSIKESRDFNIMEPVPSPMERRAGRYRSQLLVSSAKDIDYQKFLKTWVEQINSLKNSHRVRWAIDIDPQEIF